MLEPSRQVYSRTDARLFAPTKTSFWLVLGDSPSPFASALLRFLSFKLPNVELEERFSFWRRALTWSTALPGDMCMVTQIVCLCFYSVF